MEANPQVTGCRYTSVTHSPEGWHRPRVRQRPPLTLLRVHVYMKCVTISVFSPMFIFILINTNEAMIKYDKEAFIKAYQYNASDNKSNCVIRLAATVCLKIINRQLWQRLQRKDKEKTPERSHYERFIVRNGL